MTDRKEYAHGEFCWTDLSAHDMEAAKKWYGELFGWESMTMPSDGPPYAFLTSNGKGIGGMGQLNDEMKAQGVPPTWNSYVQVKDSKAIEAKVTELGGKVVFSTQKVMDAGHLAFFSDPEGAVFAVWQPGQHCGAERVNAPVSLAWNELMTRDVSKAKDFYSKLFGWEFADMPMGPITYTIVKNGGKDNGGLLPMNDEQFKGVPAHWMVYFAVEDADATVAKAKETGGKVLVPPQDTPPGRFAVLQDAQGAAFSVIKLNNPPA